MSTRRQYRRSKWRSPYVWHRYVGLLTALFACVLAVTGLVLNRTDSLGLARRHVEWTPLLDWYGIRGPDAIVSYDVDGKQLSHAGRRLYLDLEELPGDYERLQAALPLDGMFAVAADGALLLFSADGALIERVTGAPPNLLRLGLGPGTVIVADSALGPYASDAQLLQWTRWEGDSASIAWAVAAPPAPALAAALAARYRGTALSWERVLLDLHSGRLFGRHGVWVMDAAAVLLIVLALTGIWLWTRRRH